MHRAPQPTVLSDDEAEALLLAQLANYLPGYGYAVMRVLGKGQNGQVLKVQHRNTRLEYAMKVVNIEALDDEKRDKAIKEVHHLMALNHVNVIRGHHAFLHRGNLHIVMEYARHGDLLFHINEHKNLLKFPIDERIVRRVFLQLSRGLRVLHANHIIHRDLKPANVLCQGHLRREGYDEFEVKIGDMGMSKVLDREAGITYTVTGTAYYMAPEVWRQQGYSFSSDRWSLGAVMYEMMMLRPPCGGITLREVVGEITRGNFLPIPSMRYSQYLIDQCHALLSTDPADRPSLEHVEMVLSNPPPVQLIPDGLRLLSDSLRSDDSASSVATLP